MKEKYEKPEMITFEGSRGKGKESSAICLSGTIPSVSCAVGTANVGPSCTTGYNVGAANCVAGEFFSGYDDCQTGTGATTSCFPGADALNNCYTGGKDSGAFPFLSD